MFMLFAYLKYSECLD